MAGEKTPLVRAMTPGDIPGCMVLWEGAGLAHEADLEDRISRILTRAPGLSLVAVTEAEVVGCVLATYNEIALYVSRLVVGEAWRGRSVGAALMRECEVTALRVGASKVSLVAEPELTSWYEDRGYTASDAGFFYKLV